MALPPSTKTILATPLNVEESRAQRLQRSQARFRDRGGIFVPTNRNTLADILLGKAPPLKKPGRRSVSASPTKHLQKGENASTAMRRLSSPKKQKTPVRKRSASPQKQSRKSTGGRIDKVIGPTEGVASTSKPKAKGASKPAPEAVKPKAPRKANSKKQEVDESQTNHETQDIPPKANPKPRKGTKSKTLPQTGPSEPTTQRLDAPILSSSTKSGWEQATRTHKPSTSAARKPAEQSTTISKSVSKPNAPTAPYTTSTTISVSSSTISKSSKNPPRPRRKSTLYSGASEDEYIPPVSKAKPKPPKKGSVPSKNVKPPPKSVPQAGPSKLADIVEEEEEEDEAPPRRHEAPQPRITASAPKASTSNVHLTKPKKRSAPDDNVDETHSPPPAQRKKRPVQEEDEDKLSTRPLTKRAKSAIEKETIAKPVEKPKRKKQDPPPAKVVSKKRNREVGAEDEVQKPGKRKKPSPEPAQESTPEPPKNKMSRAKAAKPVSRSKKPPKPRPISVQKKSAPEPKSRPVAIRKGPPKRVLERLRARDSQLEVVDNDPDPIDFLS